MTSLQDAVDRLDAGEFDYSPANQLKIRGSARKCAKLPAYNCPLARIPADPEAFVSRWALHLDRTDTPEGFKSFASFREWHSNVKSLMERSSGAHEAKRALRAQVDGWTQLIDAAGGLVKLGRNGNRVQHVDLIALVIMRNFARAAGLQPVNITARHIEGWSRSATGGQKNSLRKAARLLDLLRQFPDVIASNLLPSEPIGVLAPATPRRRSRILPPAIRNAIDAYTEELSLGPLQPGLLSGHRGKGCTPETVKTAKDSLSWFFDGLTMLGLLSEGSDPDPGTFADIGVIQEVFDAEAQGLFPWKQLAPRSVRKNLEATFRFLQRYEPTLKLHRAQIFDTSYFDGLDEMTADNQAFCKRLIAEPLRCRTFLNLSHMLRDEAAPLIASFDTLSRSRKHVAVDLALGAALAAVLTFLPLRARTLGGLICEGPQAHVWLQHQRRAVEFTIPSTLVKNDRKIAATIERRGRSDPHAVLTWWLAQARPRLMAAIQRPDPTLLFGGADYGRLAKSWKFATARMGLFMQLHQARHAIASILINQPNADIEVIAALLGDTPDTVRRAYAFFDRERAIGRGQTGLHQVNKALESGRKAA
ncbi:MAG: hypothetical protein Q4G49_07555 [Paracoccus sp. (in: a-proteobacteria)]|nr:hypothetical protein [Paracoccus sp. (in: a-proteobacteria)]